MKIRTAMYYLYIYDLQVVADAKEIASDLIDRDHVRWVSVQVYRYYCFEIEIAAFFNRKSKRRGAHCVGVRVYVNKNWGGTNQFNSGNRRIRGSYIGGG